MEKIQLAKEDDEVEKWFISSELQHFIIICLSLMKIDCVSIVRVSLI
jgi:hypothetical protein